MAQDRHLQSARQMALGCLPAKVCRARLTANPFAEGFLFCLCRVPHSVPRVKYLSIEMI